jgi:hypothetical protein
MALGSLELCYSVLFLHVLASDGVFFLVGHGQTCGEFLVPQGDIMNLVFLRWRSRLFACLVLIAHRKLSFSPFS